MESLLPLDAVYPSWYEASNAVFIAIVKFYGKDIKQYQNQCGTQKMTFICPSAVEHFDNTPKTVTKVADDDSGFHCHQYAGEDKVAYNTRRGYENVIHSADSGTICSFYAVVRMTPKEKTWRFQFFSRQWTEIQTTQWRMYLPCKAEGQSTPFQDEECYFWKSQIVWKRITQRHDGRKYQRVTSNASI